MGGTGFIVSHLVDRLVDEGLLVRVLDNFSSGRIDNIKHRAERVEVLNGDLKDPSVALNAVTGVEVVSHFAANPEVRVSTTNPEIHFNENVVGTFNLLEAMRKVGVKQLIFASSSSVYGEPETIPVSESAPIKPVSAYGASKAACENLIHAYSRLYGIRAVALRYVNVVGPRLRHGVIYDFVVKLMKKPDTLEILGDGTQIRRYIHVSDAVEATLKVWEHLHREFEACNVGSEDQIDVNQVAQTVTSVMGLNNVKYVYKPVLYGIGWLGDVKKIALTIDKLKDLRWRPRMSSIQAVGEATKSIVEEIKNQASV